MGSLSPAPWFTGLDTNGNPLSGGKLYTYEAGTTTPLATYTDVDLSVPNANPVILDSAGRCVLYLLDRSYKFTLHTSADVLVRTQDNITSVALQAINTVIEGTAGHDITANQAVYLSDGSGGRNAGQWYRTDAANTYSSSDADQAGIAQESFTTGTTGNIVVIGRMEGFTGLTAGAQYYIAQVDVGVPAGSITSTAPTNARPIGVADSTTTLVVGNVLNAVERIHGVKTFASATTHAADVTLSSADLFITSGHIFAASGSKALTEGMATPFVEIFVPAYPGGVNASATGGVCFYSIIARDATDIQCRSGVLPFAIVNKAGTETGTVATVAASTEVVAVSTGTLTNTFTLTGTASDSMTLDANATSSLTQTALTIFYSIWLSGSVDATVTPL